MVAPAKPGSGRPTNGRRPRVTVIRGTFNANIPELGMYAGLHDYGFDPELLGARRTSYADDEVGMPVRRLATPPVSGRISKTLVGGYMIGQVSPYRYFSEYLRGFDAAVRGSDILFPTDLGHPTSFQCLRHRPRAKVVVQVWDNIPFNWPEDRPLAEHYLAVLQQADHFVPLTKEADRILRLQGVSAEKRSLVYPGIDLQTFRPPTDVERNLARTGLGAATEEIVLSFVGRIEFQKGIFTLLESLVDVDRRVKLHVFGGGKERDRAEYRARGLGVHERVKFWGPVPHKDLQARVLWASDFVCVPSLTLDIVREQFNQFFLEAMATGLAVVGTWTGGVPEVVDHGVTGLLVPPDYPPDLIEALNRLASDAPLRQKMGREGRSRAERMFNVRQSSKNLAKVLREKVLGENGSRPG